MTQLVHDVVICTRNRATELRGCLASLETQELAPNDIWVVDASDDDASDVVCDRAPSGLHIHHERSVPGLPRQRNVGISRSKADVLHFLDDDVVLEPGYLAAIDAVYAADPAGAVLGVGGLPTNLPPQPATSWLRRHLVRAERPGVVLASGRGIPVLRAVSDIDVDWMSGCCLSFRRSALGQERFDEGLSGYALGEDLEMSYRVRQHGRLVVTPHARLLHLESPTNRWGARRWGRTDVINRHRRVRSHTGAYRTQAFWLDALAQLTLWSARGFRPGGAHARALARGMVEGLIAVALGENGRDESLPPAGALPPGGEVS